MNASIPIEDAIVEGPLGRTCGHATTALLEEIGCRVAIGKHAQNAFRRKSFTPSGLLWLTRVLT